MGKGKGASIARQIRRGKRDQLGRPIAKRPFNNSKRTPGTQGQEDVKLRYLDMMERLKYIKVLARKMRNNNVYLENKTWLDTVRKYDEHKLFFDDYERNLITQIVNYG
jgi:hypothetical protein